MPAAELHQYFQAEREAGILAVGLGIASLALASYLLIARSSLRGVAWPIALIGFVELGVGLNLMVRTPAQVARLETGFHDSPGPTALSETLRMTGIRRSFRIIMAAELALILVGALMAFGLRATRISWAAVGAGLLLQASILLVFDLFAEHRAHRYVQWLSGVSQ